MVLFVCGKGKKKETCETMPLTKKKDQKKYKTPSTPSTPMEMSLLEENKKLLSLIHQFKEASTLPASVLQSQHRSLSTLSTYLKTIDTLQSHVSSKDFGSIKQHQVIAVRMQKHAQLYERKYKEERERRRRAEKTLEQLGLGTTNKTTTTTTTNKTSAAAETREGEQRSTDSRNSSSCPSEDLDTNKSWYNIEGQPRQNVPRNQRSSSGNTTSDANTSISKSSTSDQSLWNEVDANEQDNARGLLDGFKQKFESRLTQMEEYLALQNETISNLSGERDKEANMRKLLEQQLQDLQKTPIYMNKEFQAVAARPTIGIRPIGTTTLPAPTFASTKGVESKKIDTSSTQNPENKLERTKKIPKMNVTTVASNAFACSPVKFHSDVGDLNLDMSDAGSP